MAHNQLFSEIEKGKPELQHVETEDKAAPKIDTDVTLKTNKHGDLLLEVKQGKDLQHVETTDKAAPKIESDVKIGENPMKGVLADIKKAE